MGHCCLLLEWVYFFEVVGAVIENCQKPKKINLSLACPNPCYALLYKMALVHIELDVSFLVFLLDYDFLMTPIGAVLNQMRFVCKLMNVNILET